ncbi:WXG100 family type VII secretion target [Nocardia sp. NPDC020380]|uniref:WXG100 family type VII secretion target n=1 Tax=Nocardia sp. NPDC020380 TaxID=3364309 RepID=UPI0037B06BF9
MTGSSGERLSADPDTISAAADWVRTTAQDFHDDVESLMRDVRSLMEKWRGSAADTHQTAWDEWAAAARELVSGLTDDASALQGAAKTFQTTDTGSAAPFNSVTNGSIL